MELLAGPCTAAPAPRRPRSTGTHGGARPGAGRKPGRKRPVPHRARPWHRTAHPLHVTLRVRDHVWNLRTKRVLQVFRRAFAAGCERFGFRLVHYSLQGNHLHLIAEARDRVALTRGMKGLEVRIARRLNRLMDARGPVFRERYHARALHTPLEVKRALTYVFGNFRKHQAQVGKRLPEDWIDPYSSARHFDGWRPTRDWKNALRAARDPCASLPAGICAASVRLLSKGWRRHGLLDPAALPSRRALELAPHDPPHGR